jgi:hypothetical protein
MPAARMPSAFGAKTPIERADSQPARIINSAAAVTKMPAPVAARFIWRTAPCVGEVGSPGTCTAKEAAAAGSAKPKATYHLLRRLMSSV